MSANIISIDSTLTNSQRRIIVAENLTNDQFDKVLEAKTLNAVPREEVFSTKLYNGNCWLEWLLFMTVTMVIMFA